MAHQDNHDAHVRSWGHAIQSWINVRTLENWCASGGKLDKVALRETAAREIVK